MTNLKRYRTSVFLLICLISLSTLLFGCNNQKQSQKQNIQHNKFGFIDKNDISSFKVYNIKVEEKEIKNKSDRDKIIDLINSVKITKSGIQPPIGMGFGVIITYSNGEKFSAGFTTSTMGNTMGNSSDEKYIWCVIDKNIEDDLRNYYDKN